MKNKIARLLFIIFFTALAIALNVLAGGKIVYILSIPLYLDSVMTIAVVALCGLFPGIACAVLSNIFLYSTKSVVFSICHIFTAISAYVVFKYPKIFQDDDETEEFKTEKADKKLSFELFLWAGFFSGITNTISGNVISTLILSSGSEHLNSVFIKAIYAAVPNLVFANWLQGFIENIADKILSGIISFALYKMFEKLAFRFSPRHI